MSSEPTVIQAKPPEVRKRVVVTRPNPNQIPADILENKTLNYKISTTLPNNYNFELHKVIWRLRSAEAKRVALQFPEGLFVFAIKITDIIEEFTNAQVLVMGGNYRCLMI